MGMGWYLGVGRNRATLPEQGKRVLAAREQPYELLTQGPSPYNARAQARGATEGRDR